MRDDYQRKERERLNEWKRSQGSILDSPVTKSDAYATNTKSDPQPDYDDEDDDDEEERERIVEYVPESFWFEVYN